MAAAAANFEIRILRNKKHKYGGRNFNSRNPDSIWNLFDPQENQRRSEDVEDGNGQHEFPAETHELVIAKARKGPPYQKQKPAEEKYFDGESSELEQHD